MCIRDRTTVIWTKHCLRRHIRHSPYRKNSNTNGHWSRKSTCEYDNLRFVKKPIFEQFVNKLLYLKGNRVWWDQLWIKFWLWWEIIMKYFQVNAASLMSPTKNVTAEFNISVKRTFATQYPEQMCIRDRSYSVIFS